MVSLLVIALQAVPLRVILLRVVLLWVVLLRVVQLCQAWAPQTQHALPAHFTERVRY